MGLSQSALTPTLMPQPQGAFFPLAEGNWSLLNRAVEPQLQEQERMVYVAFSEFFFDSAMESYFRAGALKLSLVGDKVLDGLLGGQSRGTPHTMLDDGDSVILLCSQPPCTGTPRPGHAAESHLLWEHLLGELWQGTGMGLGLEGLASWQQPG